MESLVILQKCVITNINPYIAEIPDPHSSAIKKFIDRNRKQNAMAMKNVTLFLANPVNCYVLVKSLTRDLNYVEYILERYTDYERNQCSLNMPSERIFYSTVTQIVLLVYIFDINVREFANGTLTGDCSTLMTSGDCYEVALTAYQLKEYQIALAWLNEAYRKYPEDCHNDCLFTKSNIHREIRRVQFVQEEDHSVNRRTDIEEKEDIIGLTRGVLRKYKKPYLCRKEYTSRDRLHCQYQYGPHPFLLLARFKTELLFLNPEIVMFHDVVSDKEIEMLKFIATSKIIQTNKTYEGTSANYELTMRRHVVYIKDQVSRVAAIISQRSLDISGLTNTMAESIKVLYYGASGYHAPHVDSEVFQSVNKTKFLKNGGSKLISEISAQATVLYYLSEADLGGATAFDYINISVFPVKNSALYWRSISPSGKSDEKTLHSSCPVLHGTKWAISKWLSRPDALEVADKTPDYTPLLRLTPLSYETLKMDLNIDK